MKKILTLLLTTILLITMIGCGNKDNNKALLVNQINNFKGLDKTKDDIKLDLEGTIQDLKLPIYVDKNRYYIPLTEVANINDGQVEIKNSSIVIKMLNKIITIDSENKFWSDTEKDKQLKAKPIIKDDIVYISLIDFTNMFDLKTRWYGDTKTIKLYIDKDFEDVTVYKGHGAQKGILRFEDVSISGDGSKEESNYLETIRVMSGYLGKRNVPYHIAWIPRYIDPKKNIDVDPSKTNTFGTAELIYTLDYASFNYGLIGLHGYTHQRENEASGIGVEFGKKYPSVKELEERTEKALEIAKNMDINVDFYEAPHYEITTEQNIALEKYFKFIFNNYDFNKPLASQTKPIKAPDGKDSYFVPTPLFYILGGKEENMLSSIKNMSSGTFAGLFYHPFLEAKLIDFKEGENGYPEASYKSESILKRVIDELEKKNVTMIPITDVEE